MEDFGKLPSELFKNFNLQPVAAASLAQVFKGVTHDNKTVAIKTQYIDLRDRYGGDIGTVRFLLKLVGWIHPKFKFSWIFDVWYAHNSVVRVNDISCPLTPFNPQDLHSKLAEELDFEQEGRNLERCRVDLSGIPWVHLPHVEWGLTSKRVLTAEWIDGCRVTDRAAISAMGLTTADVSV